MASLFESTGKAQLADARASICHHTENPISGAKGRKDRPGLDDLLNQAQRGKFDVVMACRVGRSLIDLLGTIQHLEACKVDLYLDQQQIDTTTPSGRLLFQVTGAFGEFERSMIRERVDVGLSGAAGADAGGVANWGLSFKTMFATEHLPENYCDRHVKFNRSKREAKVMRKTTSSSCATAPRARSF
jgi:hypothetical protein